MLRKSNKEKRRDITVQAHDWDPAVSIIVYSVEAWIMSLSFANKCVQMELDISGMLLWYRMKGL
eukprot:CAMPEP_0178841756 /NCGR_PEP_ID=MMETSP0746-20121128/15109_1 /TAXON_ID=913974 /ORGANISM="Nitzschia punctata, Strain CCMP561" /LENGTH=63 /DNA_ID=CAMNT_0020504977 /DNA_START=252 /DNA_END=440 /DNA_ORIENTATION=-